MNSISANTLHPVSSCWKDILIYNIGCQRAFQWKIIMEQKGDSKAGQESDRSHCRTNNEWHERTDSKPEQEPI